MVFSVTYIICEGPQLDAQGRYTYSWQYKGIGNMGVQRAWSEIMNLLANTKGSVGR
jgi:hypothetical protein